MLIYSALIFILGLITCGLGILLYIPLLVIGLVFETIATIAAKKGKTYLYPITIRFVK